MLIILLNDDIAEFGYGGHPFGFSGVFEIEPRNEVALGEESFKYRETITIGYTDFNDDEVREIVKNMGNTFKGNDYHLLHRNCNHFSDHLCKVRVCVCVYFFFWKNLIV